MSHLGAFGLCNEKESSLTRLGDDLSSAEFSRISVAHTLLYLRHLGCTDRGLRRIHERYAAQYKMGKNHLRPCLVMALGPNLQSLIDISNLSVPYYLK